MTSRQEPGTHGDASHAPIDDAGGTLVADSTSGTDRAQLLQSLEAEAAAHSPILSVLAEQLRQTAGQIEQAVVGVCNNFQGMAKRARESVSEARKVLSAEPSASGGGDKRGVDKLINTTRSTLEHLMERILKGSQLSMKVVYRMDDVASGMKRIVQTLDQVNEIANVTRVLAINAKIQAVHVGEMGKGFSVVADEISSLARRSDDIARLIRDIIGEVGHEVQETVEDLRVLASEDMNEVLLSRTEVENTFGILSETHQAMEDSLRTASQRGEDLAGEVAGAVMAMQFQDRVNQRIDHVVRALDSMKQALDGPLEALLPTRPIWVENRQEELVARLRAGYTMEQERQILSQALGSTSEVPADSGSDIELF